MSLESGDKLKASGLQFEHAHLPAEVSNESVLVGGVKLEGWQLRSC